jgi:hypothetical protein
MRHNPNTAEVLKVASLAIEAHQYIEEYEPDPWDGEASYDNEAIGKLCTIVLDWEMDSLNDLISWSGRNASEVVEMLEEIRDIPNDGYDVTDSIDK